MTGVTKSENVTKIRALRLYTKSILLYLVQTLPTNICTLIIQRDRKTPVLETNSVQVFFKFFFVIFSYKYIIKRLNSNKITIGIAVTIRENTSGGVIIPDTIQIITIANFLIFTKVFRLAIPAISRQSKTTGNSNTSPKAIKKLTNYGYVPLQSNIGLKF